MWRTGVYEVDSGGWRKWFRPDEPPPPPPPPPPSFSPSPPVGSLFVHFLLFHLIAVAVVATIIIFMILFLFDSFFRFIDGPGG